ncbi:MAG: hypothetical protein R2773_01170 [Flavobacteriaceae bacterium]
MDASKRKKYLVLGILFMLPITVYIFFASGVNHFAKLPVLTPNVKELTKFHPFTNDTLQITNRITILGFFGSEVTQKKANAFNLAHKIYKKNYRFNDFQFVFLVTDDQKPAVTALLDELKQIANPERFQFAYGSPSAIQEVFDSLKTQQSLDSGFATNQVFIIDKERNLRGRNDDEDVGTLYGFDASDYAEINNKMGDDVQVILAEYRLELKKYKADRKI